MTTKELAQYLRVSISSVFRNLKDQWKDIPQNKNGKNRFDKNKVIKYLEKKFNDNRI